MKTNIPLEMNRAELEHVANLLDRKRSKRRATRRELCQLVEAAIRLILTLNVEDIEQMAAKRAHDPAVPRDFEASQYLIKDIERGGFSFIGEPPGS